MENITSPILFVSKQKKEKLWRNVRSQIFHIENLGNTPLKIYVPKVTQNLSSSENLGNTPHVVYNVAT